MPTILARRHPATELLRQAYIDPIVYHVVEFNGSYRTSGVIGIENKQIAYIWPKWGNENIKDKIIPRRNAVYAIRNYSQ